MASVDFDPCLYIRPLLSSEIKQSNHFIFAFLRQPTSINDEKTNDSLKNYDFQEKIPVKLTAYVDAQKLVNVWK